MARPVILAAVDLGPHSRAVVDRAVAYAAEQGAEVAVIHCRDDDAPAAPAEAALAALLERVPRDRLRDAQVLPGEPADLLLAQADALGARMIVVGASSRSFLDQVFRGGVTVALVRRSARPILVARTPAARPYRHALVAVGINALVAPVAAAVRGLVGPVDVELFTVIDEAVRLQMIIAQAEGNDVRTHEEQCIHEAYRILVAAAGQVAEPGWAPRARVAQGVPSREIRARVEAMAADLLVLQPEAKGPFLRALIGSLTEEILARPLDCDVLILPAQV